MSLGIERLRLGQAVEVRRRKPGPGGGKPVDTWERGATFSHYTSKGLPAVEWPDGARIETLQSLEEVRPC